MKERVQGVGAETCKPMTTLETRVSPSLRRQQDTCKGLTVEYEKAVSTPNYIMKCGKVEGKQVKILASHVSDLFLHL